MLVAEKYRLQRQIGWNDAAEVHSGPADAAHGVPVVVKIRHGTGGPPRPDGNRERFLRASKDQQAAVDAGCRQVAPVFETGLEGDNAFYAGPLYQRSLDSLIQGRVSLDHAALRRVTASVLQALEELRDRAGRAHGNLKPTNIFLDGKTVPTATAVLGDLALRADAGSQAADCYALGTVIFQLVRGRTIRHFDWPIEPGPDWERLGANADSWRGFCNVVMAPDLATRTDALAAARQAFKNLRKLAATGGGRPGSPAGGRSSAPSRAGLWTVLGLGAVAATAAGAILLPPANSTFGKRVRGIPALGVVFNRIDGPVPPTRGVELPGPSPGTDPSATRDPSPPPDIRRAEFPAATPAPTVADMTPAPAEPTPAIAEATPTPPPTPNPRDQWIGYTALLQKFREIVNTPNALDQTDVLTTGLGNLRESVGYLPVKEDPAVVDFLRKLPAKVEATGDQPDLPVNLWTKETTNRQGDLQSITYQWGRTGFRFVFNRVNASANSPAFYLSATAVPVQFGFVLAQMAAAGGGAPLSGVTSVKGPVAWEAPGGRYALRPSWMVLDNINSPFYANSGRPAADSPMNGLSAQEAVRLARAAGCALPTLGQWNAVLASSSGQQWTAQWQTAAKVRSPEWAALARNIQSQHLTGAKLPNDQCFGDRNDLNAVTQTSGPNLFFEGVGSRTLAGYAHLIGNVGQYLVDDARNPTKYYFAGGSAESAPATFQSLGTPPVVVSPFLSAADGGLRLAAFAKGDGNEKNPVFDKLKGDLDAELARVQKL